VNAQEYADLANNLPFAGVPNGATPPVLMEEVNDEDVYDKAVTKSIQSLRALYAVPQRYTGALGPGGLPVGL